MTITYKYCAGLGVLLIFGGPSTWVVFLMVDCCELPRKSSLVDFPLPCVGRLITMI